MISPLSGWSWEQRRAGIVLRGAGCEVRYVERVRPLDVVSKMVARAPRWPGFVDERSAPVERFVTDEGEHAAQVTLPGTRHGLPATRSLAFVFGDDFVARIDGRGDEAVVPVVRELAVADAHCLGVRRRRYLHAVAGEGWHGYRAGLFHSHWLPLDHPADPTTISVLPALPGDPDSVLSVVCGEVDELSTPAHVTAQAGLSGFWSHRVGAERTLDVIVLADERYTYPLVMRSAPARRAQHLSTLAAMACSIEPVPRSRSSHLALGSPSLMQWVD